MDCNDIKQNSACLGMKWEVGVGKEILEECDQPFVPKHSDHFLDYGDGFITIYTYKNISNWALQICLDCFCLFYLNKAVF